MRQLLPALVLLAAACHTGASTSAVTVSTTTPDIARLRTDVAWLADDAREGRGTGTAGNDSAAHYIARRMAALRLVPLGLDAARANCSGATAAGRSDCYLQPFAARPAALVHSGGPAQLPTANIVGLIEGRDPALRGEVVVLGAHMDHLGRSPQFSLDADLKDAVRNGADDNASGTAAVLELARLLKANPPRRSVVVALFSAEEYGLLGAQHLVANMPAAAPLSRVAAMLNFDMVGRMKEDKLLLLGAATATEWSALIDSANAPSKLRISASGDGFGSSDHAAFYAQGIPVVHFFTDIHEDYHRASDDAAKINAEGMAKVVGVAERLTRLVADRDARLTFVRPVARATPSGAAAGTGVYFGSIPDMAAGDEPGLRLSGVSAGGPADKAGLKAGDIIVEFDGKAVVDLQSYTDALRARKPGDEVVVIVKRAGQRVSLKATLGTRGQ